MVILDVEDYNKRNGKTASQHRKLQKTESQPKHNQQWYIQQDNKKVS